MSMLRRLSKYLLVSLFSVLMCFILYTLAYLNNTIMPWERKEAIEVTLLWAGAKNLPKSAEITRLEMTGSAFSRGFEMEFKSNKSDLEWWILNSKTVEFASEKINKVNATIYVLTPAMEKAQYAKVHINWVTSSVFIRVYWS